jgi:ketosteroid isomerase-like protein
LSVGALANDLPLVEVHALIGGNMRRYRMRLFRSVVFLAVSCVMLTGCRSSSESPSESPSPPSPQDVTVVPPDLQETVDSFSHALAAVDIPALLAVYADDFQSGSRRSKEGVREVFTRLQEHHVKLEVEKASIEKVDGDAALLRTQVRLRYVDHFRDLGEGEVVVTDVLRHALQKEPAGWKIHTDERLSTYREGRFGAQAPNVQIEVPGQLSEKLEYPITVSVHRDAATEYQVMMGNYVEDPAVLPPPDIVTELPDDGVLRAHLLPNPQGRSEMVRVTVIAAAADGHWIGATTISKFVPAGERKEKMDEDEQELTEARPWNKGRA